MTDCKSAWEKFRLKLIKPKVSEGKISKQWLLIMIPAAFFILLLVLATLLLLFEMKYLDRFFPGSQIGQIRLEGLTSTEALNLLDNITNKLEHDGIKIAYRKNGQEVNLEFAGAVNGLSDPDLSRPLITYDDHQTVYQAFAAGRGTDWWHNLGEQWRIISNQEKFLAAFTVDEPTLAKILRQQFSDKETPNRNAGAKVTCAGDQCQIQITPEEKGMTFDYQTAIDQLKTNLANLNGDPIELKQIELVPDITLAEAQNNQNLLEQALAKGGAAFHYQASQWTMGKNELGQLLEFAKRDGRIIVQANRDKLNAWLKKIIAPAVETPAQNATIEIKDGQVTKLSAHHDGQALDLDKIYSDFNDQLATSSELKITLSVKDLVPDVVTENINDLGIKEIIGVGQSNFVGSPVNRIHNIKNGASKVHGVLIKPGEEFSLIKTLGPVEGYTGYLPELVIKGNKTTPEFGGGLCQIGTTMFRAALESGLPITERTNHSYNVTYYLENGLPGADATIYIPHPDVRFINDTGNYILIQSRIEGTKLFFEFWGTKDGRTAQRTKPKVWGWTAPDPPKLIETLDLKPGQKKCTEKAHKGVNASFDYTITYSGGEVKKQSFYSHYKPWQEVCLIGVDKLSSTTAEVVSSSPALPTPDNSSTTTSP